MVTDAYNRVQGYDNVFAIGDISIQFTDPDYPNGHPQLAQPAIQQGKTLAKNLLARAKGRSPKPFKYFDRGDMAIIGRKFAVADLFKHKVHLGGLLGLISWLSFTLFRWSTTITRSRCSIIGVSLTLRQTRHCA